MKIFKFHKIIFLIILIVCALCAYFLIKIRTQLNIHPFLFWYMLFCCILGPFFIVSFRVELALHEIHGFYEVLGKKIVVFSCLVTNIARIGYTRGGFMLGCAGSGKTMFIATGIKGYKDILRMIIEKNPAVIIEESARKRMIRDEIISA